MQNYRIYAGGNFVSSSRELIIHNPYDGEAVGRTWLADDSMLDRSVECAREALPLLWEMPAYQRSEALFKLSEGLLKEEETFAAIIASEAAKPWRYAISEVRRAAQTFLVAAEEARRLPMEYMRLDWRPEGVGREGLVKYFPVGVVAGISPFNFPLNLAVHKIAPAIAAGCPIILKPASSTPLSTLALAKLAAETGLPPGTLSVLPMDRQTGNRLVTDDRIRLLSFTGSPEVGWKMKEAAGKKKVVLELGGNAGTIVTQSARLDEAVSRCLVGGFAYQGQVCIHAQRIFVHEDVFGAFRDAFLMGVEALRRGHPLSPETDITAMIDQDNAERMEAWTREAVADGATVLCGGRRDGAYFEPTVLTGAVPGMKVVDNEVFGPLVTLHPFSDFMEAIEGVNNSRYGLQAGVFTNSVEELDLAFNKLEVGGVIHNDAPIFRSDHMPYGGVKDSGLGREGVKYAMHDMLEPRILVKRSASH
jgi:acyl-CoA reductase-like NAD-dependent aldehyde dehydrogenase